MKIALDYRPALFSHSGIARSVRELAQALAEHEEDIELHLFGHAWKSARFPGFPRRASLHRSRLPGRSLRLLRSLGLDAARLSGRSDLFHWTDYVYPPVASGTRVVQTVHDLAFLSDSRFHGEVQSRILANRFAKAVRRADGIICPSEATARDLRHHFPDLENIHVIPFGVDHVFVQRTNPAKGRSRAAELLSSHRPYLLCLATLEPRKNHETLLEAWRSLPAPRPPLLFVGAPGWESKRLMQTLERGQDGLAWTGEISDDDLFDLLAGAHALLYPSSLEGFGFPPMEALELGIPPLVGDCDALREQLGEAALYVNGQDVPRLAEALRRIYTDDNLRSRILNRWRERPVRLTWKGCARRHHDVYRSILAREARRR